MRNQAAHSQTARTKERQTMNKNYIEAAETWLSCARGCLLASKEEADLKERLDLVLQVFAHLRRAVHLIDIGDGSDA